MRVRTFERQARSGAFVRAAIKHKTPPRATLDRSTPARAFPLSPEFRKVSVREVYERFFFFFVRSDRDLVERSEFAGVDLDGGALD